MENIQSLSICCPSATGKCINHCKTCTARQLDELSALLKRNTALIYQKVAEQLQKENPNG